MVRTSNDVNISNSERAAVANNAGADAFVRHTRERFGKRGCERGDDDLPDILQSVQCFPLYKEQKSFLPCAGCAGGIDRMQKEYVWETDSMSGINWCQVPVTIVEMGYMTNPAEDTRMATSDYQAKIAAGIANGIDAYFAENN